MLLVKCIVATFILHPEQQHNSRCQTHSQAAYIYDTVKFTRFQIAPGGFEVPFKHDCMFYVISFIFKLSNFQIAYSVLKLFTGLATAAFIAWYETVTRARPHADIPAMANTHHCTST